LADAFQELIAKVIMHSAELLMKVLFVILESQLSLVIEGSAVNSWRLSFMKTAFSISEKKAIFYTK
jgi:hypothetical protein